MGVKAKRTMPTRKRRPVDDLSIPELRHLLLEKEHNVHDQRLAHYQKTGRVVQVTRDLGIETEKELSIPDIDPLLDVPAKPFKRRGQTRWVDSLLFLVEAAAVIGLIFVLFNGFSVLRNLNREVIAALEQPTLVPTPLIVAVVLPGGHTPPNSAEGAQPNSGEKGANIYWRNAARELVKAAYSESPHVFDPFSGYGAIPGEAARLGCESVASDLNPVALLCLRTLLEAVPRHNEKLIEKFREGAEFVRKEAEKRLSKYYAKHKGKQPIAWLWARTVTCEGPGCGATIPLTHQPQ